MATTESFEAMMGRIADEHDGGPASPGGYYDPDGDCLFYHAEDVPYVAVRLSPEVTLFEAMDDGHPVGIQIKGIRTLLEFAKGLRVSIHKTHQNVAITYLVTFAIAHGVSRSDRFALPPADQFCRAIQSTQGWSVPSSEVLQAVST